MLESIDFIWDLHEQEWLDRFEELTNYQVENGDCNVPESQGPLGLWVQNRRQEFKEGKLAGERIARLKSIGFVWDLKEQGWTERFGELTNYKAGNGEVIATSQAVRVHWAGGWTSNELTTRTESCRRNG